jgi:tetratricopeptide (TPR) repeat protein
LLAFCLTCVAVPLAAAASPRQDAGADRATLQQIAASIERGDLDAAGRAIEPALKAHPSDPLLHNLAGVVSAQRDAFAPAEAHFRTAMKLAPSSPAAYENLGRLYQERAGDNREMRAKAIAVYRQLLEIAPGHTEALFQGGLMLALDRQFADSRAMLERLPDEIRKGPQAQALLAADLANLNDTAAARRAIDSVSADPALSEPDVLSVLAIFPPTEAGNTLAVLMLETLDKRGLVTARGLRALASIHMRAGRFAEARTVLERVAAAEDASAPVLVELARTAIKLKDYQAALGYLAHARSLAPADATIHFLFGMVCVEENLGREAYDSMKKAVELDPENPSINYAMGAVATHRHEPSESLPYFRKYVQLKPGDPRGHFALGAALFYSNEFDQARPELERAARAPETATGGHYFLARIARQLNDLPTARREVEETLRLDAGLADAWAELGLIQTRSAEYDAARASLAKALAIDPDHYLAAVNLATLYARTKDPRREEQAARVEALGKKRDERAQEFLRIIKAVPYGQ